MRLLLIRHGQSTNNLAAETGSGEDSREPDPPLTDLGHTQAEALATWLDEIGWVPDHLYSSLMSRTIQTAAPIAARFGLSIEARDDLHEAGGPYVGDYLEASPHPGSTRDQLSALTASVRLPDRVTEQGWWWDEVETNAVAHRRALAVVGWLWDQASQREASEQVAIVAHGAFLSMLLTALMNPGEASAAASRVDAGADESPVWFQFDNTSTSLIDLSASPNRAMVAWINRIDHLRKMAPPRPSLTSNPFPPAPSRTLEVP